MGVAAGAVGVDPATFAGDADVDPDAEPSMLSHVRRQVQVSVRYCRRQTLKLLDKNVIIES